MRRKSDTSTEIFQVSHPDIGGHDDDRIAEIHSAAESSGKDTVIQHLQQPPVRFRWSKARKKREARYKKRQWMKRNGIPIPKPDKYIDPDRPVINAVSREEVKKQIQEADAVAMKELSKKLEQAKSTKWNRFHFNNLQMSDRVAKLFDLKNGSQREVIQAQKHLGMRVFQKRPGDTGSTSVQIIALTTRIQSYNAHLTRHKKEFAGKRRLQILTGRRRRLLNYLERTDFDEYRKVVKTLGLPR